MAKECHSSKIKFVVVGVGSSCQKLIKIILDMGNDCGKMNISEVEK